MRCTGPANKASAHSTDVTCCTGTHRGQKTLFPVDVLVATHTHPGAGRSVLLALVGVTGADFNEGGGGFCFDGAGLRCSLVLLSPELLSYRTWDNCPVGHVPPDCYYDLFSILEVKLYTLKRRKFVVGF